MSATYHGPMQTLHGYMTVVINGKNSAIIKSFDPNDPMGSEYSTRLYGKDYKMFVYLKRINGEWKLKNQPNNPEKAYVVLNHAEFGIEETSEPVLQKASNIAYQVMREFEQKNPKVFEFWKMINKIEKKERELKKSLETLEILKGATV